MGNTINIGSMSGVLLKKLTEIGVDLSSNNLTLNASFKKVKDFGYKGTFAEWVEFCKLKGYIDNVLESKEPTEKIINSTEIINTELGITNNEIEDVINEVENIDVTPTEIITPTKSEVKDINPLNKNIEKALKIGALAVITYLVVTKLIIKKTNK